MPVILKSPREIQKMRQSGQVVRQVLDAEESVRIKDDPDLPGWCGGRSAGE